MIILVGNKQDLVEEKPENREVTLEEAQNKYKENGIVWGGECSAKNFSEEEFKDMIKKFSEQIFQKVGYISNKGEIVNNSSFDKGKKKSRC